MKKKIYAIKILIIIASFWGGYGINKLTSYLKDSLFVTYEIDPLGDNILKHHKAMIEKGTPDVFSKCSNFYFASGYPTYCEVLLDEIIAFNKYNTPGIASDIHEKISVLTNETFLYKDETYVREELMFRATYTLYGISNDFLYRAAKMGDLYAIKTIYSEMYRGNNSYDEKLDSFPRKYQNLDSAFKSYTAKLARKYPQVEIYY